MEHEKKDFAWMVRADGTAIPCASHIYGSIVYVEETVYAAEWLYRNTAYEEVKELVIRFLSAYAKSLHSQKNLRDRLLEQIKKQPYLTLTKAFILLIGDQLSEETEDLQTLNRQVCDALNSEFLRTRFGGKYDTEPGNHDLYFRISSEDFPWGDAVRSFLEAHKDFGVETVTVLFDKESTGKDDFLKDSNGRTIDRLPLKELEL